MTENEAIERIIRSACSSGKCYDACLYGEGNCEYDVAISVLKEIRQYREIGTVEECREAVAKQKQKKPVLRDDNGKLRKSCPVCGCFFSPLSRSCPKCGQAIQWDANLEGMEDV